MPGWSKGVKKRKKKSVFKPGHKLWSRGAGSVEEEQEVTDAAAAGSPVGGLKEEESPQSPDANQRCLRQRPPMYQPATRWTGADPV